LKGKAGLPSSSSSKLTDVWQSEEDFCTSFGGSSNEESLCFNGKTVSFNANKEPPPSPKGVCLEKIGNGSYLNLAPHPDGSNKAFVSSQAGKIWLATIPEQGSGGALQIDEAHPFLDLTDEVHVDSEFGLMGLAFHPKFASNGRFFVSYNCDRTQSPSCAGRCSCNSDADCDPSKLGTDNGAQPCQYQVVVSEYSAKVSSNISKATSANPSEVRRIFTMGLPYTSHHGGQILFGPTDGYLYLMMGDGGSKGDPFNFSQNKKSLLGKIMRLDVDGTQNQSQTSNQSLWGSYSIPKDNPFADDANLQPEIWALGFSNPWRCSFDSERPSYFYCGDVGQV
jgi:glucose/arabinose dehydrogenase